jgi:hypothetical protein
MNDNVKRFMRKLTRRIDTLVNLESTACGHEENLAQADIYRTKMLKWTAEEVEKMLFKDRDLAAQIFHKVVGGFDSAYDKMKQEHPKV